MKSHRGMKSQDIAILLFIGQYVDGKYKMHEIGKALAISQSEVSESINRSKIAKLINTENKKIFRNGLYEFIVYGIKYVFPIIPGAVSRGIATAHSAPPLSKEIISEKDQFVWQYSKGNNRGMMIEPLYKTLPAICKKYPEFYELLCLVDAIRIGRAREISMARNILKERLLGNE